jgi:hypothetical protein
MAFIFKIKGKKYLSYDGMGIPFGVKSIKVDARKLSDYDFLYAPGINGFLLKKKRRKK